MSKMSRREFLSSLLAGMGAIAVDQVLIACGVKPNLEVPTATNVPPTSVPSQPSTPTSTTVSPTKSTSKTSVPTPVQFETALSPSATPPGMPDLVVARGGEPEDLVRRALAALGGIEKFVPKGAKVIVKPNICVAYHTYEYAATTNPWVVGALVKMCLEAGASSVQVMDYGFGGTPQEAYTISGIAEQVKAAGGEMAYMPGFKYITTEIPNGVDLKKSDIFEDILKADVLIDVPIAKHHGEARLTLGMKNWMGVIRNRSAIHQNLGQRIADLNTLIRPKLTVVDAVRILMANGPTGGDLNDVKKLDTVIASPDIVAADSYATTLFGMKPDDIDYIRIGAAMGLGRSDLGSLKIEEI